MIDHKFTRASSRVPCTGPIEDTGIHVPKLSKRSTQLLQLQWILCATGARARTKRQARPAVRAYFPLHVTPVASPSARTHVRTCRRAGRELRLRHACAKRRWDSCFPRTHDNCVLRRVALCSRATQPAGRPGHDLQDGNINIPSNRWAAKVSESPDKRSISVLGTHIHTHACFDYSICLFIIMFMPLII